MFGIKGSALSAPKHDSNPKLFIHIACDYIKESSVEYLFIYLHNLK